MAVGPPEFIRWTFLWDLLNIIVINLILSGDNAVLIAMALTPSLARDLHVSLLALLIVSLGYGILRLARASSARAHQPMALGGSAE